MNTILIPLALFCISAVLQNEIAQVKKTIQKNGMLVTWFYSNDRIHFDLSAPTTGWITVGFNEREELSGAYLLITRIYGSHPQLVEHVVYAPGDYKPIEDTLPAVADVEGNESSKQSWVHFSLPITSTSDHAKTLQKGQHVHMILAYSNSDDFQHHSVMRTAIRVRL